MKPLTPPQKDQLEEDTFALILRHGWEPFVAAVARFCEGVAFHGYLTDWIWRERARLVRNTRAVSRRKPCPR